MVTFRYFIIIWILIPYISAKNCTTPPQIENGYVLASLPTRWTEDGLIKFTPGMSIPPKTKVIYKCNTKCYSMGGRNKMFCKKTGIYNREPPQCVEAPQRCRPAWIKENIINATQEYADRVYELNAKWWNDSLLTMEERQAYILICLYRKIAARDALRPLLRKSDKLFQSEKNELAEFVQEFEKIGIVFAKLRRSWLNMDINEQIIEVEQSTPTN
ncbi:unnamed protein product [Owenia fusiformis]|uniref:Sushi domain-containing protein n=1 Tax=Owenia fusiformis TaxID=6347 RepID=A0A8S4NA37_OWEFU|nr:unnamed protein product [Owenia fusiformis]